jgi:uncharacterized protein YndB with AHSA1/START domain
MAAEPLTTSVFVEAEPHEVYEYFTRAEAMVRWMGQYALLDARPGGEFTVDIEGTPVRGRYQTLDPPDRIVFSWGFAGSEELPPGSSTVEVRFVREATGTRVDVVHSGLPPARTPTHAAGWRRYLDRLALEVSGSSIDPGRAGAGQDDEGGRNSSSARA